MQKLHLMTITKATLKFGGEEMIVEDTFISCPSKNAVADLNLIEAFMADRRKRICGKRTDTDEICYIWEDHVYVHIGCLKELKDSFQEKYIQLIKDLNS